MIGIGYLSLSATADITTSEVKIDRASAPHLKITTVY